MGRVSADTKELVDMVQQMQKAVESIENTKRLIQTRYNKLGESWKDKKYQNLGDIVNECTKALNNILKILLHTEKYILQLVKTLENYEEVNIVAQEVNSNNISSTLQAHSDSIANANSGVILNEFGVQSIESVKSWVTSINPNPYNDPRRNVNCGKCAEAVYKRLNGENDAIAGLGTYSIEEMNDITGRTQTAMTPEQIESFLISQGAGSHVVVGVDRASGAGHWFNAYYDGYHVYTIEGQGGVVEGWPPDYGNVVYWDISI